MLKNFTSYNKVIMNRGEMNEFHNRKYRINGNIINHDLNMDIGIYIKEMSLYKNLIIIQNIVIGLCVSIFYFIITKDFNLAITLSGLFAETGYNLIHNIEKLIKEGKNG